MISKKLIFIKFPCFNASYAWYLMQKKLKVEALTRYFEAFARLKQGTLPHSPLDPSLPGKAPVELCLSAGFFWHFRRKSTKRCWLHSGSTFLMPSKPCKLKATQTVKQRNLVEDKYCKFASGSPWILCQKTKRQLLAGWSRFSRKKIRWDFFFRFWIALRLQAKEKFLTTGSFGLEYREVNHKRGKASLLIFLVSNSLVVGGLFMLLLWGDLVVRGVVVASLGLVWLVLAKLISITKIANASNQGLQKKQK